MPFLCQTGVQNAHLGLKNFMLLLLVTNTPAVQHGLHQAGESRQLDKTPITLTQVPGISAFLFLQAGRFWEVREVMCE